MIVIDIMPSSHYFSVLMNVLVIRRLGMNRKFVVADGIIGALRSFECFSSALTLSSNNPHVLV